MLHGPFCSSFVGVMTPFDLSRQRQSWAIQTHAEYNHTRSPAIFTGYSRQLQHLELGIEDKDDLRQVRPVIVIIMTLTIVISTECAWGRERRRRRRRFDEQRRARRIRYTIDTQTSPGQSSRTPALQYSIRVVATCQSESPP